MLLLIDGIGKLGMVVLAAESMGMAELMGIAMVSVELMDGMGRAFGWGKGVEEGISKA
jgi:Na+/glutamate symporter